VAFCSLEVLYFSSVTVSKTNTLSSLFYEVKKRGFDVAVRNSEEVLSMYRIITGCVVICSLLLALPLVASAVSIDRDFAFIDNRPADDIFGITGLRLNLTVRALDPGGYAALTGPGSGTQATASNGSFPFSQPVTYSNPNDFFPVSGGAEFTRLLGNPLGIGQFPSVTGTYTYTVRNTIGQTATSTTHNLDKLEIIPIPINLTFSNYSTTPIFTFTDPGSTPGITNLRRDYMVEIFNASMINIFQSDLLGTPNFEVPIGILEPGMLYYFRAVSIDFDRADFSGTELGHSNLENRALAYATFTAPVPEPSTMLLLGSGLVGLVGYGRRKFFRKPV